MDGDGDRLSFLGRPIPAAFEHRIIAIEAGGEEPCDGLAWRDALVVVEGGELALDCAGGVGATFLTGDVLWLAGLSVRTLRNRGPGRLVVSAVRRARQDGRPGEGSEESEEMTTDEERSMPTTIEDLRSGLAGTVIAPGDPTYDEARAVFYGGIDRRPAMIVRAANADDVSRVINRARDDEIELAVRSGGHSVAGHGVTEGGIVLDLSPMKAIEIDGAGRTAWAETGLTAAEVATATAEHGLAIGFGDTGSVGIGGITLGGGVGYLARRYGLTIDDLLAAEIVTADGELVRADEASHPDLFWAIRGGGGNFGVATRFRFRLHELATVVGGMLLLPATAETILAFMEFAEEAPDELSGIANVMPAPPMPFVPEEHHGRLSIMALMCYAGDAAAGERAIAPFRTLAEPLADMVREIPYPDLYPPDEPGYHPVAVARTMFVDGVDRAGVETMVDRLDSSTAPMRVVQLRPLGGAVARVTNDATAYAHRDRRMMVNVAALYEDPSERELHAAWVDDIVASIQRGPVAAYVNFLGDEGAARVRDAYPEPTWDRLVEVKARYDPTNLFRLNQNVPPPSDDAPPRST